MPRFQPARALRRLRCHQGFDPIRRWYSPAPSPPGRLDSVAVLARPTWSVQSLLPSDTDNNQTTGGTGHRTDIADADSIDGTRLRHLLRLSALPPPEDAAEEARMISVLRSQLRFVRDIQAVDVSGVEPLRSIRDETSQGIAEATIGVEQLRDALAQETPLRHTKRPRRQKTAVDTAGVEDWDALQTASQAAGRYFVVRSAKPT